MEFDAIFCTAIAIASIHYITNPAIASIQWQAPAPGETAERMQNTSD